MQTSQNSKRKIVVTGGGGFVGRNLVDALANAGAQVVNIDFGGKPWRDDVVHIDGDIRDAKLMNDACVGAETVFHNASIVHTKHNRQDEIWSVNLGGTEAVLAACKANKVPKLVYVSTASAVYEGRDIKDGNEELPYSTISQAPYADSKIAAEKLVLAANGPELATCAIRPHVVFGPGDSRFLPAILKRARAGRLNFSVGDGSKLSDFTYISNLVDALVAVEEKLAPGSVVAGQAYFVTNGEPYGFFKFVAELMAELQLPAMKYAIPYWLAYTVASIAEGWDTLKGGTLNAESGMTRFAVRYMCTDHYFSIAKAGRDFGYKPKVSIAEGIKLTAAHLRSQG